VDEDDTAGVVDAGLADDVGRVHDAGADTATTAGPEQGGRQARVARLVNNRATTPTGYKILQELHTEVAQDQVFRGLDLVLDCQQRRVALRLVAVHADDCDDCLVALVSVSNLADGDVETSSDTTEQGQENGPLVFQAATPRHHQSQHQ